MTRDALQTVLGKMWNFLDAASLERKISDVYTRKWAVPSVLRSITVSLASGDPFVVRVTDPALDGKDTISELTALISAHTGTRSDLLQLFRIGQQDDVLLTRGDVLGNTCSVLALQDGAADWCWDINSSAVTEGMMTLADGQKGAQNVRVSGVEVHAPKLDFVRAFRDGQYPAFFGEQLGYTVPPASTCQYLVCSRPIPATSGHHAISIDQSCIV